MGGFIHDPRYSPAEFRGVSAPDADTLYPLAWLDRTEPQVFSHPDMGKRLYPFAMTHLWMRPERASGSITDVFGSKLGPFVPEYPAKMRYNTQTKP